jgi:hypothetical protein
MTPSPRGRCPRTALDGDGLTDIGLYNHHERAAGSLMLLLGQPCPAGPDGD